MLQFTDGLGYASAYSQLADSYQPTRRIEANTATSSFSSSSAMGNNNNNNNNFGYQRPATRSLGGRAQAQQQQATGTGASSSSSFSSYSRQQQQQQSLEKGDGSAVPLPPPPAFLTGPQKGFVPFPSDAHQQPHQQQPCTSATCSSYSSSSSFSSSSTGNSAAEAASELFQQAVNRKPAKWMGAIPIDATVTQAAGSAHKTYTWKVTDATGYTTTHWYTGPLGADRMPVLASSSIPLPSEFNVAPISPGSTAAATGRLPSWTGPIPRDATITQTPGSSYKTYTWKVTDVNGYTTTHWYSGPLGPDGGPAKVIQALLLLFLFFSFKFSLFV